MQQFYMRNQTCESNSSLINAFAEYGEIVFQRDMAWATFGRKGSRTTSESVQMPKGHQSPEDIEQLFSNMLNHLLSRVVKFQTSIQFLI